MSIVLGIPAHELADRITAQELLEWQAFERLFGPLTVQERVDVAGGLASWGALTAAGAKVNPMELIPNWQRKAGDGEDDGMDDDVMIAVMRELQAKGIDSGDSA